MVGRPRPSTPVLGKVAKWRDDPPATLGRWVPLLGASGGVVGLLGLGLASWGLAFLYMLPCITLCAAPLAFILIFLTLSKWPSRRERDALTRDADPEPGETVRRATYLAGIWPDITGRDLAVIEFVDGWLVVRGARADWSVRPTDVRLYGHYPPSIAWREADGTGREVVLDDGDGTLLPALREWAAGPSPDGEPVMPPRAPTRRALATARDKGLFWSVGSIAPLVWVSTWFEFAPVETVIFLLVAALVLAPAACSLARWRFLTRLRRAASVSSQRGRHPSQRTL